MTRALRREWDLAHQTLLLLKRNKKDCSVVPNLKSESSLKSLRSSLNSSLESLCVCDLSPSLKHKSPFLGNNGTFIFMICYILLWPMSRDGNIGNINSAHFFQNSFIYEISCLLTFCACSLNIIESSWKYVKMLAKKNVCIKIPLHTNIRARKAAIFPGVITFISTAPRSTLSVSLSNFWPNKRRHSR